MLLVFPSHCTHRLQPLDLSFFTSLNNLYNVEVTNWLRSHPGRAVTESEMPGLLNQAYGRAATVKNGTAGFAAAGICPFNDAIFTEEDYAAAAVTDHCDPALIVDDPLNSSVTSVPEPEVLKQSHILASEIGTQFGEDVPELEFENQATSPIFWHQQLKHNLVKMFLNRNSKTIPYSGTGY